MRERTIPTEEHLEHLRELCPKGSTVYTILRHRARSGMMRRISLVVIVEHDLGPYLQDVSMSASKVLGRRINRDDFGIVCNGAGMDMGFELVYSLAAALYGDGYALSQRWV